VNIFDAADLKAHGIDPAGGLGAWFDDPDETTIIVKVSDEAAAEDVLEDMFHEMDRDKETKEGIKITHYRKATDYGMKKGFAYAFVDGFMLVLAYSTMAAEPPSLGAWAKRAFSIDESLADGEPFKRGSKLLGGGTNVLTYHFNPEAFFAAQKKKLEKERDDALKREKGAAPAAATPTDIVIGTELMKKMPVADKMAPEPLPGPKPYPDPYDPPPTDPFGSSYGAKSSDALKEELKKLAELQDEVDWATGITAGWAFDGDLVTGDLVVEMTQETADSTRAAIPELGPDTGKLEKNAIAFLRVAASGDPLFKAIEPLLDAAATGSMGGLLGMMMGLPSDPKVLRDMAKEMEKFVTGTAEVLLLPPPAEIKDEVGALRAVGVALWTGKDKVGETVDDFAEAAAEGAGLDKDGKDEVGGVTVRRYTAEVPGKKGKTMKLPLAYAADGEWAMGAAGEGVIDEALGSAGPTKTAKNDGVFVHLAIFPSRVPLKGYPTTTYLAATPVVMLYLRWIEKMEVVGKARAEGLHIHGELKIAKP
jgi:hypothetical protein